jgi:molybdate transport system substrate-binding protein
MTATQTRVVTMRSHQQSGAKSRRLLLWSLCLLYLTGSTRFPATNVAAQEPVVITVSAAISLKDCLDEIGHLYEAKHPGSKLAFNYGGSGTLQRQIEQGAPVDLFFSAAEKPMDDLAAKDLIDARTRHDIVMNTLVLIAPASSTMTKDFRDLTQPSVRIIALGEPNTVPAGMYGKQTLEHMSLFSAIEKKIVYANDVRAVLTYVETGNADAGLVYITDAKTSRTVRVVAIAPADSHDPIVYPAAVLRNSHNADAAQDFLEFLEQSDARDVFQKYGFASAKRSALKK